MSGHRKNINRTYGASKLVVDNLCKRCLVACGGNLGVNMKRLALIALLPSLVACQTSYTYVAFVPNPEQFDMAQAKCQMMSNGVQQGYFAYGSPSFVAGAGIGNAIGNAIRVDQFMAQCMTLQGYKRVPKSGAATQAAGGNHATLTGRPVKLGGSFPPAPKP